MADLIEKIRITLRERGEKGYTFLCNPSEVPLSLLRKKYCERKQVCLASRELWFGDVRTNDEQTPVDGEKGVRILCKAPKVSLWRVMCEYCARTGVPRNALHLWFGGVRRDVHQTLEDIQMLEYDVLELRLVPIPVLEWETTLTPRKLTKLQLPVRFHPYLADRKVVRLKVEWAGCWNVEVKDDHHGHFYFKTGDWKQFVHESELRSSEKLKLKDVVRGRRLVSFNAYKL